MSVLKSKIALVTGASSGIGRATALLFAAEGAKVIVTARREVELETLVQEIEMAGGNAIALAGDVRDEAHSEKLVDLAIRSYGRLDIAFNNAATLGTMGPVESLSLADWNETLAINLTSAFLGAKYQIPAMARNGGGSLIFTSTFVGHTAGLPGMSAYAASKAGLIGLMQVLAIEYAHKGIRVNAILPGGTDTAMAPQDEGFRAFAENLHAFKRLAAPEEIARSVLHLASDASSFMTGVAMLVDGGVSVNRT